MTDHVTRHKIVADLLERAQRHETAHETAHETVQGSTRVVWHVWGDGPPLVLLHGSHGGWMHWVRNIADLARDRRVIVPDMPGFGESDPVADIESPAAHAAPLASGLAQLGLRGSPVDLACFSLGALIGCHIAILAPALLRRLVLIDAGGLGTPFRPADLRAIRGSAPEERRELNRHNLGAMMIHDPARIDDLAIDIAMHYGPLVRSRAQYHVLPEGLLEAVRKTSAPIDLIWGEHDLPHPFPELNADVVRMIQPDCRLRVVADAGHWAMYEQPERFNAALRGLLPPVAKKA